MSRNGFFPFCERVQNFNHVFDRSSRSKGPSVYLSYRWNMCPQSRWLLPRIPFHVPSVQPSPVEMEHVSTSPDIATNRVVLGVPGQQLCF
jgi:hypothetical protein